MFIDLVINYDMIFGHCTLMLICYIQMFMKLYVPNDRKYG